MIELTDEEIDSIAAKCKYDFHATMIDHRAMARAVIAADRAKRVPMTEEEILDAAERIRKEKVERANEEKAKLVGTACWRCGQGHMFMDSNGYNEFLRCNQCRHVPMLINGRDVYKDLP